MHSRKQFLKLAGLGMAGAIVPGRAFAERKAYSSYRIFLSDGASESEKWAARELQHWLGEISGDYVAFHNLKKPYKGGRITVGYTPEVKTITGLPEPADDDESYHYFSENGNLFIYGGRTRGTMYGVFSFLENEFGCRWYTPRVTLIPKKPDLSFGEYSRRESAGIQVRNNFNFEAFDSTWAARNKMNGRMRFHTDNAVSGQQPGGEEVYWSVHTFFLLVPPAEFYDTHPEYYSLIGGERVHERAQLCLSNPDVLEIVTERIREVIRKHPKFLIYDVSQNNSHNACQCVDCQTIVQREGAESGIIIWFVNQVAEEIEKDYPEKYIGTLAYRYTRKPPQTIRPRRNVVVRLCTNEACAAHSLEECPQNSSFTEDMKTWASISSQVYIWDYVVNFVHYMIPYPNFYVLQPNIKTFRDNNAIGIMEQAGYQSRGGDFQELRCYVIAKLLWNPDCNFEEIIDDFIYGYYGRSGRFIRAYFDLTHELVKPDTHMRKGLDADDKMFSDDFVDRSLKLFEKATRVAEDSETLARVELTSLSVLYLKCRRNPMMARKEGTYQKFLKIVAREGVTHFAEYGETQEGFMKLIEDVEGSK